MLLFLTISYVVIATYIYFGKWNVAVGVQSRELIKDRYITAMFLFFGIITALRNVAVGSDTYAYYNMFEEASSKSFSSIWQSFIDYYAHGIGKDAGYPVLTKLFSFVCPSFRGFLFFNAIVFYAGAAYIIRVNTRTPLQAFLAIILFITLFFPYAISAVRQNFALGCVMFSYKFIKERRLIPFLLLILLASTIHKSVLIFIPYYWIAAFKSVRFLSFLSILIIPVLFFLAKPLTLLLVDTSGSAQYALYVAQDKEAGTPTFTVLLIGCLIMYILTIKNFNRSIPNHHYFTNTIFLTVGLCPVTWIVPDFMRILLYFSCFLPVIMANSITLIRNRSISRYLVVIFVIAVTYLFIKNIPPYDFFWNQMDLGANYGYNRITQGL